MVTGDELTVTSAADLEKAGLGGVAIYLWVWIWEEWNPIEEESSIASDQED